MKNPIRWGVVALLIVAGAVGNVQAQPGAATKVGTVNMGYLFTKYKKAEILKNELENELKPIKMEADKIKDIMQQHAKYLKEAKGKNPAQDDISMKAVKDGQRALEDLEFRARTQIVKKQETQLVTLYKDIHAAVQIYAQQNGFHLILAYGDPLDGDPFEIGRITRKMQAFDSGAVSAYYVQGNLDVSNDVLARLNSMFTPQPGQGGVVPAGVR